MSKEFRSDPKAIEVINKGVDLIMEKQGYMTQEQWQMLLAFTIPAEDIIDCTKAQKKRYEELAKAYSEVDKVYKEYKAKIEEA